MLEDTVEMPTHITWFSIKRGSSQAKESGCSSLLTPALSREVGLDDLQMFFQPPPFCVSMIL